MEKPLLKKQNIIVKMARIGIVSTNGASTLYQIFYNTRGFKNNFECPYVLASCPHPTPLKEYLQIIANKIKM